MSTELKKEEITVDMFNWSNPLDTVFVHNHIVRAMKRLGITGSVSEYRNGTKEVDARLSWHTDADLILKRYLDAIDTFRGNVEKHRAILDYEVWMGCNIDESKLYFGIRAEDYPASSCSRMYSFNSYHLALQALYILKIDLERAYASKKEPIKQVVEMWKVVEWHDTIDPNIQLLKPLWVYAKEGQKLG